MIVMNLIWLIICLVVAHILLFILPLLVQAGLRLKKLKNKRLPRSFLIILGLQNLFMKLFRGMKVFFLFLMEGFFGLGEIFRN